MRKTTQKVITISVVAVVLAGGIGYLLGYSLVSDDLDKKSDEINSLNKKIAIKENKLAAKNRTIFLLENDKHSLESNIENTQNFERMLLKGIKYQMDAAVNKGYGSSDYDDSLRNYEAGYYEVAQTYADSVDVYYGYARNNMDDAKSRFELARKYAPSKKYLRLIDNYIKASEYAIQIYREMHQAGEYHSTASGYYADGNWSAGNDALEEGNYHIDVHDNLIDNYNTCLGNIGAILDDW